MPHFFKIHYHLRYFRRLRQNSYYTNHSFCIGWEITPFETNLDIIDTGIKVYIKLVNILSLKTENK